MIEYITIIAIPLMILVIIIIGLKEKKDVYSLFIAGATEGLKTVYNIFPYILGITVAVGLLNDSGVVGKILTPFSNILLKFGIPNNVVSLILLTPLSGGASMSMVMEIFKEHGPDSLSGNIASIMMGATETTIYTMTILYSAAKIKKIRGTLIAGLIADITVILLSIIIANIVF